MLHYEPRDKSGPMEVDQPDLHNRLAQFALPEQEEGPARKRLHSEISTPSRPFAPHPSHRPMHFGTNTPFIFHTANIPQPSFTPFKPYNPADWTADSFGFGQAPDQGRGSSSRAGTTAVSAHAAGLEDVDMRGDTPQKGELVGSASTDGQRRGEAVTEGSSRREAQGTDGISPMPSELPDADPQPSRKIAGGAISRVRRRRQKEWRRRSRVEGESEGESDGEPRTVSRHRDPRTGEHGPSKSEHTYHFNMVPPSMRHSEVPALLLGYLQFFVNAAVVVFVLFFAVQFVLTVRRDVLDRMQEYSVENLQEIAECTKLYLTNRCDPALRVPAMEAPCKAWEACMQRDPTVVGRSNVVAETFAGVINSFVDPISWKTMGFTLVTLSFLIILTNSALWNLRGRVSEPAHSQSYQHQGLHQPWLPPQQGWGPPGLSPATGSGDHGLEGAGSSRAQIGWAGEKKKGWLW